MTDNILISYDPSNGEIIGQVERTRIEDIPEKVQVARKAQKLWAELTVDERISYLEKCAESLSNKADEITQLLSREMGKDLKRASNEVQSCIQDVPFKTREIKEAIKTKVMENDRMKTQLQYNPLGVCAVIAPWNYPVSMGHWLILPALTAGNTVVYKPSEETPLVADAYVKAFNEVLPEGVLQIIHGDGEQGRALVQADVDLIGFTGSREAGKNIMKSAASDLKRLILELGGKDPLIVMEDADIGRAAHFAVASSLENTGQMCVATERILVDEKIADEFEKQAAANAQRYKVGPWTDPEANIGPIINEKQRNKILSHIEDAIAKGAKVLAGGVDHPPRYILPTVLTNITEDMLIWQEETFGPVVCIKRYSDIEEAIKLANASELGLGGVVFGNKDAEEVANRLEVGMVGINRGPSGLGDIPWVGAKQSGIGYHGSPDGHRQFTQARVVSKRK
ncbi:MAG: aldehyde dehydrogenase family protein [Anaerovoracaceae bacterium]|jgi:succinate-semialdehyde dehydrogenase/glutarate-semialdehyde dehydrogenase